MADSEIISEEKYISKNKYSFEDESVNKPLKKEKNLNSYYILTPDGRRYELPAYAGDLCILIQELEPELGSEILTMEDYPDEDIKDSIDFLEHLYGLNKMINKMKKIEDILDYETVNLLVETFRDNFAYTFRYRSFLDFFKGKRADKNNFLGWLVFDLSMYAEINNYKLTGNFIDRKLILVNKLKGWESYGSSIFKYINDFEDVLLLERVRPDYEYSDRLMRLIMRRETNPEIPSIILERHKELIIPEFVKLSKYRIFSYKTCLTENFMRVVIENLNWEEINVSNGRDSVLGCLEVILTEIMRELQFKNIEDIEYVNNYITYIKEIRRKILELEPERIGRFNELRVIYRNLIRRGLTVEKVNRFFELIGQPDEE